jgi:hypothetical protein
MSRGQYTEHKQTLFVISLIILLLKYKFMLKYHCTSWSYIDYLLILAYSTPYSWSCEVDNGMLKASSYGGGEGSPLFKSFDPLSSRFAWEGL